MVDRDLREAEQRECGAFKMAPDNTGKTNREPSKRPAQIEYECAQIEKVSGLEVTKNSVSWLREDRRPRSTGIT
eukprot:83933-Hanusia_phi.AAC.1